MSLPALNKQNSFNLDEKELEILQLVLANELNPVEKRKTNKQLAELAGVTVYKVKNTKAKQDFKDARFALAKDKSRDLLALSVNELEKLIADEKTSGTTKIKAIQLVFASNGLTKQAAEPADNSKQAVSESEIDALLKRYNIIESKPKPAEKVDSES